METGKCNRTFVTDRTLLRSAWAGATKHLAKLIVRNQQQQYIEKGYRTISVSLESLPGSRGSALQQHTMTLPLSEGESSEVTITNYDRSSLFMFLSRVACEPRQHGWFEF